MYNLQKQSYSGIQKVTITTIEMKVNKTIIKTLPRRIQTLYTFFMIKKKSISFNLLANFHFYFLW